MKKKTITINKRDLIEIISWSFVQGVLSERYRKQKRANLVIHKKDYKEAKQFILDAYWYQREHDSVVSLMPKVGKFKKRVESEVDTK